MCLPYYQSLVRGSLNYSTEVLSSLVYHVTTATLRGGGGGGWFRVMRAELT